MNTSLVSLKDKLSKLYDQVTFTRTYPTQPKHLGLIRDTFFVEEINGFGLVTDSYYMSRINYFKVFAAILVVPLLVIWLFSLLDQFSCD